MAQYVVVRDCYALGRLWLKGEEVELAGVRVPSHFKEIKGTEAQLAERAASLMGMPADGNLDKDANAADEQPAEKEPDDDKADEQIVEKEPEYANAAIGQTAEKEPEDAKIAEQADDEGAEAPKALEQMNVFTLRKLALDAGIELEKDAKKTEIIAALRGE